MMFSFFSQEEFEKIISDATEIVRVYPKYDDSKFVVDFQRSYLDELTGAMVVMATYTEQVTGNEGEFIQILDKIGTVDEFARYGLAKYIAELAIDRLMTFIRLLELK